MLLDDTATILAHADFFDILSEEQRRMLAFASERRKFAPGDTLIAPDKAPDGAFVLVSGTVASVPADGPGRLETSTRGALLGGIGLLLDRPRPVTVTAVTGVEAIFVSRPTYTKLLQQNPEIADRVATRIKRELGAYVGAIERVKPRLSRRGG